MPQYQHAMLNLLNQEKPDAHSLRFHGFAIKQRQQLTTTFIQTHFKKQTKNIISSVWDLKLKKQ